MLYFNYRWCYLENCVANQLLSFKMAVSKVKLEHIWKQFYISLRISFTWQDHNHMVSGAYFPIKGPPGKTCTPLQSTLKTCHKTNTQNARTQKLAQLKIIPYSFSENAKQSKWKNGSFNPYKLSYMFFFKVRNRNKKLLEKSYRHKEQIA